MPTSAQRPFSKNRLLRRSAGEGGNAAALPDLGLARSKDCCKGGFLGRRSRPEQGPNVQESEANVATLGSLVST